MTDFTVGDLEPPLTGTALDGTTPVDLTAADSLAVHIRRPDGTTIERAPVADPDQGGSGAGRWTLTWQSGDLPSRGLYHVELQVTWPGSRPQTFAGAASYFQVRDQIA